MGIAQPWRRSALPECSCLWLVVCFVGRITQKLPNGFPVNLGGRMGRGPIKNPLNFGTALDIIVCAIWCSFFRGQLGIGSTEFHSSFVTLVQIYSIMARHQVLAFYQVLRCNVSNVPNQEQNNDSKSPPILTVD